MITKFTLENTTNGKMLTAEIDGVELSEHVNDDNTVERFDSNIKVNQSRQLVGLGLTAEIVFDKMDEFLKLS